MITQPITGLGLSFGEDESTQSQLVDRIIDSTGQRYLRHGAG